MARTRSSLVLEGVPGTPGRALVSAARHLGDDPVCNRSLIVKRRVEGQEHERVQRHEHGGVRVSEDGDPASLTGFEKREAVVTSDDAKTSVAALTTATENAGCLFTTKQ